MLQRFRTLAWLILLGMWVGACTCSKQPDIERKPMSVVLYQGIRGFVMLGDYESQVMHRAPCPSKRKELRGDESQTRLGFTHMQQFPQVGTRIYFREGKVALIEVQEPFLGRIQGKTLDLFGFNLAQPPGTRWGDLILREMGPPEVKVFGGRLGSEAFFYPWGDISFNRMGPNEMALYREAEIGQFRQRRFGRNIQFFPQN